jgi:hypothetical protein
LNRVKVFFPLNRRKKAQTCSLFWWYSTQYLRKGNLFLLFQLDKLGRFIFWFIIRIILLNIFFVSGLFSFYSYRDPNFESTFEAFDKSADWISKSESFCDRDIVEAKLGLFQSIDAPILPGTRGLGPFLSGISDEMFLEHRRRLRDVTRDDLIRVSDRYLTQKNNIGISVIGPESSSTKLDSTWDVQQLVV